MRTLRQADAKRLAELAEQVRSCQDPGLVPSLIDEMLSLKLRCRLEGNSGGEGDESARS